MRTDEKREETKGDSKINISFKNTKKHKKEQHRRDCFRKYKLQILAMKIYDY